jgi:hypothetical protein
MNDLHRRRLQIVDIRLLILTHAASNLIARLNELNGLRELVRKAQLSDQRRRIRSARTVPITLSDDPIKFRALPARLSLRR